MLVFTQINFREIRKLIIGLLVIIVIITILTFGNIKLGEFNTYTTIVSEIDSLKLNAPVFYLEKQVGFVSNISINPETFNLVVSINVEKNIKLTQDSFVSIRGSGFFGSKFITIYPGNSDKILADGDQIMFSQGAVNVEKFINLILDYAEKK